MISKANLPKFIGVVVIAQSCLSLCDPTDCSMPGFPVLHHLLELAQTHVLRVGDAIQPYYPLSSPSPDFHLSKNQGCFYESVLHIKWPMYWSFSISPSNEYSGLVAFRINWFNLLAVQRTLKRFLQYQFESINSSVLSLVYGPTLTSVHNY